MTTSSLKDKYGIIGLLCYSLIMLFLALSADSTCGNGDSICHYLFARYAVIHHELFLNHWAKPLYVLIACPLAQFGFIGVKLLNTFLSCVAMWFTYLIAREMQYRWAAFVFVLAIFFKVFTLTTLSGLTEPLHNAMLAIAIYLAFTKRYFWAVILVSFLPFVRSEGLFIAGTFALYLIWMRQWWVLPLLLLGHVIYSLAGYSYYHDLLWVFHKIPYAGADGHYGHGTWSAFVDAMPYITAPVNCALLVIGLLLALASSLSHLFQKKVQSFNFEPLFLSILFLVFFSMHTTFWALGIFGSFGLIRVFIAIAGVMLLIMIPAVEFLDDLLGKYLKVHAKILGVILVSVSLFFALGPTPFAYHRAEDFDLHPFQQTDKEVATFIKLKYPEYKSYHLFFDATYYGEVLNIDLFDEHKYTANDPSTSAASYPSKSIVIWDDWYSYFEHHITLETLRNNKSLKEIKTFETAKPKGGIRQVVLFVRDN